MANLKWFASLVLAATVVSTLVAETHCPGNVASVPFHLVNRYQIIVAVSVNNSGPYNFLLDTGTQLTMVDPTLAAELHLGTYGNAEVASVGIHAPASFAKLDSIRAGSQAVTNQKVLVYDLRNLQASGLNIQGVLGEDFLEQFDMLIDNAHSLLCLDNQRGIHRYAHTLPGLLVKDNSFVAIVSVLSQHDRLERELNAVCGPQIDAVFSFTRGAVLVVDRSGLGSFGFDQIELCNYFQPFA